MRWTWPSWTAILLGAAALAGGLAVASGGLSHLAPALVVAGGVLLAAGLHGLQTASAASSCCCDWGGCDCDHCAECAGGGCCGSCACWDEGPEGGPGHAHGNGAAHSH